MTSHVKLLPSPPLSFPLEHRVRPLADMAKQPLELRPPQFGRRDPALAAVVAHEIKRAMSYATETVVEYWPTQQPRSLIGSVTSIVGYLVVAMALAAFARAAS